MKIQNLSFHIDLIPWIFFRSSKVFSKFPKEVTLINSGLCGFSWSHSLFAQVRFPSFQIRLMIKIFTAYSWWSLLTKDLYFRKLPIRFWLLSIFQMSNVYPACTPVLRIQKSFRFQQSEGSVATWKWRVSFISVSKVWFYLVQWS